LAVANPEHANKHRLRAQSHPQAEVVIKCAFANSPNMMDPKLLLGLLIGIGTSILGNIITILFPKFWPFVVTWFKRGQADSLRQQVKVTQQRRDGLINIQSHDRHFIANILSYLSFVLALFLFSVSCVAVSYFVINVTAAASEKLHLAALVSLLTALVLSVSMTFDAQNEGHKE
jgi:hypothetical protein